MIFDFRSHFPKDVSVVVDVGSHTLWPGVLTGLTGHNHNGMIVGTVRYARPMYQTVARGSHDISDIYLVGGDDGLRAISDDKLLVERLYATWMRRKAEDFSRETGLIMNSADNYKRKTSSLEGIQLDRATLVEA